MKDLNFESEREAIEYYNWTTKKRLLEEKDKLVEFRKNCGYAYHQETEKRLDEIELELEFL